MTPHKKYLGRDLVPELAELVEPHQTYVSSSHKVLYDLENRRSETIQDCAREWARISGVSENMHWKQSVPQALFDTLEAFSPIYSIIAAEAFLKQFGWKVVRPGATTTASIADGTRKALHDFFTRINRSHAWSSSDDEKLIALIVSEIGRCVPPARDPAALWEAYLADLAMASRRRRAP